MHKLVILLTCYLHSKRLNYSTMNVIVQQVNLFEVEKKTVNSEED